MFGQLSFELILFAIQACLLIGAFSFLIYTLKWVLSSHADVPFVPTPASAFSRIRSALEIHSGDTVYELGSGDGRFLIACAILFPEASFVGIEWNPVLHLAARLKKRLAGNPPNVSFRRGNFFEADFSSTTKIYAYLLPNVMDQLLPKFEQQFHGRIASRAFRFKNKKETAIIELSAKPGSHGEHLLYVYDF